MSSATSGTSSSGIWATTPATQSASYGKPKSSPYVTICSTTVWRSGSSAGAEPSGVEACAADESGTVEGGSVVADETSGAPTMATPAAMTTTAIPTRQRTVERGMA